MSFVERLKWFLQLVVQVEVIIALGGFSAILLEPVKNEYVFKEVLGSNLSKANASECRRANFSTDGTVFEHDVSRWVLLFDLTMFIPASVAGVLLMSWSDRIGRRAAMVTSLMSMTLANVLFTLSIHFKWPLKSLFLVNLVGGLGGYYMTLLMQGFAYISDITTLASRGMRFVILDMSLGIAGGVAGVLSGFWVKQGFFFPVLVSAIVCGVALLLVGVLPDSAKIKEKRNKESDLPECDCDITQRENSCDEFSESSSTSSLITNEHQRSSEKYSVVDLLKAVWRVYSKDYSHCFKCSGAFDPNQNYSLKADRCKHGGGLYPGRSWRMWFYLLSYNLYMFSNIGTLVFQTIYFLSPPLCFTPVVVGIQLGVKYAGVAITPFLVLFYQRCLKLSNNTIIIIGICAMLTSFIIIGLADTSYVVFIGTGVLAFSLTTKPFIQTQMSGMVAEWEQGSAFALLSCTEIITFLCSTAAFLTLYPATLYIYHGFCWFFAAVISSISMMLITVVFVCDRRRDTARSPPLFVNE